MTTRKDRRAQTDPTQNKKRAWKIAINPRDYSKSERRLLIKRGISHYTNGDQIDQKALLTSTSQFVVDALDRKLKDEIVNNPPDIINRPGDMALLMSLGSLLVRRHDLIENDPRNTKVHKHVREYYLNLIYAAAKHAEHRSEIMLATGELVYSRDQEDEYGPPTGRPVEGITKLDNLDGLYFKIPLTHANRKCESRIGNKNDGNLRCIIDGPYVYVPINDVHEKYKEYFTGRSGVAYLLEQIVKQSISGDRLDMYQESLAGVNNRIDELNKMGRENVLFEERRYPAKLEAILRAVEGVDEDIAKLGEPLTAEQIYDAARDYATWTETKWVENECEKIQSPSSIATSLSNYAKKEDLSHVTMTHREGQPDLYELEYMVGNFKQIEVTEIGDLLELPCMQNLHESLVQKKPVRWELYSFVRYLLEVNNVEFTIDDIQDWFSQYDWHRPDVTDYQVKYERQQVMANGDRPLPISCNNDNRNWGEHCIGKESCDYSLYRSVELKPDVYGRAGGD